MRTFNDLKGCFLLIIVGLIAGGCQSTANITWRRPNPIATNAKHELDVSKLAEDTRSKGGPRDIGNHTFTVFAAPTGTIYSTTPVSQAVDKAIRQALEAAGYEVRNVPKENSSSPVCRGQIDKFWFISYMWFWPIMIVGGDVQVTLFLEDSGGHELWRQTFKKNSTSIVPFAAIGFDDRIRDALSGVLKQIAKACSSQEFRKALTRETET